MTTIRNVIEHLDGEADRLIRDLDRLMDARDLAGHLGRVEREVDLHGRKVLNVLLRAVESMNGSELHLVDSAYERIAEIRRLIARVREAIQKSFHDGVRHAVALLVGTIRDLIWIERRALFPLAESTLDGRDVQPLLTRMESLA